jgi:hypothetical protein
MTLKASNTNTTLAPKSIFEAAGVQEIDLSMKRERPLVTDNPDFRDELTARADTSLGKSLPERVTKLEEQVDSLLDRVAKYNIRAQHRI